MKNIRLRGVIDRAARADENDTLQTKSALGELGYYKLPSYGLTGTRTSRCSTASRNTNARTNFVSTG